jgi:hypothetical protein
MDSISGFRWTGYEKIPVLLGPWAELFTVLVIKAALSWGPTVALYPAQQKTE